MHKQRRGSLSWILAITGTCLAVPAACKGRTFHGDGDDHQAGASGETGTDTGGAAPTGGTGGRASGGTGTSGGRAGASDTGGTSGQGGGQGGGSAGEPEGGTSGNAGAGGEGGGGCEPPSAVCGTGCVNLDTDEENCGACGYRCVHERDCVAGRCTPAWQPLSTTNAPSARTAHAAAYLGGKYVVLGGSLVHQGVAIDSAAAYDPATDEWSTLASLVSARCGHQAVSTGTDVLTFGGLTNCGNGTTVGPVLERFVPGSSGGAWSNVNVIGAPTPRYAFAAAWTGTVFFVYGGGDNTLPTLATGEAYSPTGMSWTNVSCSLANCDRGNGTLFKDGNVMRFFGGVYNPIYPTPPSSINDATTGLAYDLAGHTWSTWPYPSGTAEHLAARFADDGRRLYFLKSTNVVTIYDRATSSFIANDTAAMPNGFCTEAAAVWTGAEVVAWSGSCGGAPVSVGGRYQPRAP